MKKISVTAIFLTLFSANAYADSDNLTTYQITADKLDNSRNNLSPKTGTSSYSFKKSDIQNLPKGGFNSLDQVLLQAPGVAQDSHGEFHVRGDHSNVQYRINGVIIPEGISGFGQNLDPRLIEKANFLTGALPAQYGYRTAGIVDITTKNGFGKKGGKSELMTGSYNTIGANQQFSGAEGKLNYYINASYLQNDMGIASPTSGKNSIHNFTRQDKEFGYFSYLLDKQSRLNLILSNSTNRFEIPNVPGQTPSYDLSGTQPINSADLDQRQNEYNRFAIASLQGITDSETDYQLSAFSRSSRVKFIPDYEGDLQYNGVASNVNNNSFSNGIQNDMSYQLNNKNILRGGFNVIMNQTKSVTNTGVFPVDADGEPTSTTPENIAGYSKTDSYLYGLYLQDEWKALKDLTINFGGRFDVSKADIQESQLSPRINAVYDLNKQTKLHAGYAKYFTPPSPDLVSNAMINNFQGTTNQQPGTENDKVRSERTDYYDVGIMHKLTKYVNIGVDAYYKKIRNMLDEEQFGQALINTPFNYDKAKSYGVEFTADYRKDRLSAYFNFAVQKTKAKGINSSQYLFDPDELNYINNNYVTPDHDQRYTISAGSSYLLYGTNYSLTGIYGSGLVNGEIGNQGHLPHYFQIDLGATRDFTLPLFNKVNGRFTIINVTDEKYEIRDGTGIGTAAAQYGPRRSFYLTLAKEF